MVWLCNIRKREYGIWVGREVTEDETGCHRDGPLHALLPGAFESLSKSEKIEQMNGYPGWYEGIVPLELIW